MQRAKGHIRGTFFFEEGFTGYPAAVMSFEQGPIRPPSEARSLLVRVSRNCPWNRCAFCPVYKGTRFSLRSADEVLADLDAMKRLRGGHWRTAFLQDADPLSTKPAELVRILEGLRERFPSVQRVTAYARSRSLARLGLEDLCSLRAAGLDRVHVGFETGCDAVLALVEKGVRREQQIRGCRKAVQAGFELSVYVMPGLGGAEHSSAHADDTASALRDIEPHFVRLRTTVALPGTPLHSLGEQGRWTPLGENETLVELRRFLAGLGDLHTRLESDHVLNLLMELRGDLPRELPGLLATIDGFLARPLRQQQRYALARRLGWTMSLRHFDKLDLEQEAEEALCSLEEQGRDIGEVLALLRGRTM